jgi:hypothetical protein
VLHFSIVMLNVIMLNVVPPSISHLNQSIVSRQNDFWQKKWNL